MSEPLRKGKKDTREQKGLALKQIRESKGMSLMTVHEATKIPMDALRAIEEGYTVRTLSSFYIKGFLKMYAQYLGVDVSKVIDDYHTEKLPEHVNDRQFDSFEEKLNAIIAPEKKLLFSRIVVIAIIVFVVFKIGKFIVHHQSLKAKNGTATQTVVTRESQEKKKQREEAVRRAAEQKKQKEAANEAVARAAATTPKKKEMKVTVSVRAKQKSWLRVKADNSVVFQSILKRGVVETWSAAETIEISGRNISQLEFEHNGKMVGPLEKIDRQIKRVVFTKSGFSVKE